MHQAEFHHHVGAENICPNIKAALERATAIRMASATGAAFHRASVPSR